MKWIAATAVLRWEAGNLVRECLSVSRREDADTELAPVQVNQPLCFSTHSALNSLLEGGGYRSPLLCENFQVLGSTSSESDSK